VPDRKTALSLALCAAAGALAAVLWWPGWGFAVVTLAYVAGSLVQMPVPRGSGVSAGPAVAGAVALSHGGSPVMVLATAAVALPVTWMLVSIVYGRRVLSDRYPAGQVGLVVFTAVYSTVGWLPEHNDVLHPAALPMFLAAAVAAFVAIAGTRALTQAQKRGASRRLVFLGALNEWPAYALQFSSAALYAVTAPAMGAWSILLAGFPYAFGHLALYRLSAAQVAYDQTIRSVGRIPEAGGHLTRGHAERTAALAVAMAGDLGLPANVVQRVEYAALLHDIGRLALANPAVAGGAYADEDVSGWSAAIISEARYLDSVAAVVAAQHQPYRRPGEVRNPAVPRSAQVLRIAAAYDGARNLGRTEVEALEQLHRGSAYDYDPDVVGALRRVLERRAGGPEGPRALLTERKATDHVA
jgi:hypothetical protein